MCWALDWYRLQQDDVKLSLLVGVTQNNVILMACVINSVNDLEGKDLSFFLFIL